jgi:hypothetical protein
MLPKRDGITAAVFSCREDDSHTIAFTSRHIIIWIGSIASRAHANYTTNASHPGASQHTET